VRTVSSRLMLENKLSYMRAGKKGGGGVNKSTWEISGRGEGGVSYSSFYPEDGGDTFLRKVG
jgi:hypothetical protein